MSTARRQERQERRALSVNPKNPDEGAAARVMSMQNAAALAATPVGHHSSGFSRHAMLEKISSLLQGNTLYSANGLATVREFWNGLSRDARIRAVLEMAGGDAALARTRSRNAKRLGFPL